MLMSGQLEKQSKLIVGSKNAGNSRQLARSHSRVRRRRRRSTRSALSLLDSAWSGMVNWSPLLIIECDAVTEDFLLDLNAEPELSSYLALSLCPPWSLSLLHCGFFSKVQPSETNFLYIVTRPSQRPSCLCLPHTHTHRRTQSYCVCVRVCLRFLLQLPRWLDKARVDARVKLALPAGSAANNVP